MVLSESKQTNHFIVKFYKRFSQLVMEKISVRILVFNNGVWKLGFDIVDPSWYIETFDDSPGMFFLLHDKIMLLTMRSLNINKIGATGGIKYLVKRKR